MIRQSTRVFIWTYLSIGVLILILSILKEKKIDKDILPLFIFLPILYGFGVLIGLVLSIIIQNPKRENRLYFIGQSLSLAFLLFILMKSYFEDSKKTYADRNEITIRNTQPFIQVAYEKMKSNFSSPNDFLIHTYYSIGRDSVENFQVDTVFKVYFVYNLRKLPKINYFSKFIVYKNIATLEEFEMMTNNNKEYKNLLEVGNRIDHLIDKYEPQNDDRDDSFKLK